MAIQRNQNQGSGDKPGEEQNPPAPPPGDSPELQAAKARIAELEQKLEEKNQSLSELVEEIPKLRTALLEAQMGPIGEGPELPKEFKPRDPRDEEKAEFERVRESKFANGMVYCEALKTVFGHGEVKYPTQHFWQRAELAREQEKNGDLKILASP